MEITLKDIFDKERDDLSVRALNILLKLEIFEYNQFHNFVTTNNWSYDFLKVQNCGQHTADELNALIKLIRNKSESIKPYEVGLFSVFENPLSLNLEKPSSRIIDLYKPFLRNFSINNLEAGKLKYFRDEYNFLYNGLSVRSKNVLNLLKITDLDGLIEFLTQSEYGFKFSKVENCGKKSEKEILVFLKGILSFIRSEKKIDEERIASSLFGILKEEIFNSKKFTSKEVEILKMRFKLENNSPEAKRIALQSIADKFSLTRERIRQLESTLPRKITLLTNSIIREFRIDTSKYSSGNYYLIDDSYTTAINEAESTAFSTSFVILIMSSIYKFGYSIHRFKKGNEIFGIAIDKKISFNFSKSFDYLMDIIENPARKEDVIIPLNVLIKEYYSCDNLPEEKTISEILFQFVSYYPDTKISDDKIIFLRNTELKVYEHIKNILYEYRKPLHFTQIFNLLKERGLEVLNPININSILIRYSEVFGLKGQGIYGLREWGGYFGTIGDVAEEFIKNKNAPVSMRDLEKFLCHELIISQESIREVLFHYSAEDRFIKYRDGKIGLKKWENGQIKNHK